MNARRLLCLLRGDVTDDAVITTAIRVAADHRRHIRFVYVILMGHELPLDAPVVARVEEGERRLRRAESAAHIGGHANGAILQARSIGPVLIREALEFDADTIVMSANVHNRHGTRQLDVDSQHVVSNSPCAVVLVRDAAPDFKPTTEVVDTHAEA